MAIVTGREYEHIDFTRNNITTRHPLKDATARSMAEEIVKVQDQTPELDHNKIWIKETPGSEITLPTYEDFEDLGEDLSNVVKVSETQPHNTANKLWIVDGADQTMSVPTYAEFTEMGSMIKVSSSRPYEKSNKLWIMDGADQIMAVPTYAEFEGIVDAYNALEARVAALEAIIGETN